ncbi:hypothetical protein HYH03_007865 [Edaphochlamys debaryana]|uniref:Uncharacterized protein n=1 Tax=Edaphochlamys debaryana TaxID=47281 RepID=A0A835Y2A9_9CHLO|nr:hypothetical protein HYH03_007865 [Edaphochlamys debaryana]|eukprot:KAG2493934.1 hypothetical protein HYH03_007865 [Edaphochlamys debaryana]
MAEYSALPPGPPRRPPLPHFPAAARHPPLDQQSLSLHQQHQLQLQQQQQQQQHQLYLQQQKAAAAGAAAATTVALGLAAPDQPLVIRELTLQPKEPQQDWRIGAGVQTQTNPLYQHGPGAGAGAPGAGAASTSGRGSRAPSESDTAQQQDNGPDPHRLLKLSHTLRYQLAQPLKRDPPLRPDPKKPGQGGEGGQVQDGEGGAMYTQGGFGSQELPPLTGPGTKSGPYTGFASKQWLETEVKKDIDSLREHVDTYASKREHRGFEGERQAMLAEIEHLRKRLAEAEDRVVRLELMMPDEDGEFRGLKAELEELEKEADYFCDMYDREVKATKAALQGFRVAVEHIDDIEQEFERLRALMDKLSGVGVAGAAFMVQQGPTQPPPAPEVVEPRGCCYCFRLKPRAPAAPKSPPKPKPKKRLMHGKPPKKRK